MNDIDATLPQIRAHPSRDGVQLVDPIQDTQFTLLTAGPVAPRHCDTERFYFPADVAATLRTDQVDTPGNVPTWIRDESGDTVAEVGTDESTTLSPAQYHVDPSTTGIRIQFVVDGALNVENVDGRTRYAVADADTVHLGVRSLHERPAATVTTTDAPTDVMAAVSTLGSALKTTTCERSFPTLRGHPPLFERGDSLHVPSEVKPPDNGIAIEIPRSFEYIYPVVSLAYYLGATVRPGTRPRLVTDDWEYDLARGDGFEATVRRVLEQVFLLDCVTRTEGYYDVDLHERRRVEAETDLNFAALYDRPLADQLPVYLDITYDALAEAMPAWKLTADVEPAAAHLSTIPFLANELAVVRTPEPANTTDFSPDCLAQTVGEMVRSGTTGRVCGGGTRAGTRSSGMADRDPLIMLDDADSIEQTYIGDGIPLGASKMTGEAYYRRLDYEPSTEPQISIGVVCNDEEMAEENVVSDIYGTREWIEFDISFEQHLSTAELRDVLRSDLDLLHYIGHVDSAGIRCSDGHLDARELTEVNVSAFILNACDSYKQGRALVDHGAMAGMATLTEVNIDLATSVGRTVAHLLNQGFAFAATMVLVEEYEPIGHHYLVVGDASTSVVHSQSGTPFTVEVDEQSEDEYRMTLFGYPRLDYQLGTLFTPYVPNEQRHFLNSGSLGSYRLSETELSEFLSDGRTPVICDSELSWSHQFVATD
jgi:hypothetical protein